MSESPEGVISFDEFVKVKMCVGKVVEAIDHPNADRLLVIKVDIGQEQRQIIAGIKGHYAPEALIGKNLIVVTNIAPRINVPVTSMATRRRNSASEQTGDGTIPSLRNLACTNSSIFVAATCVGSSAPARSETARITGTDATPLS